MAMRIRKAILGLIAFCMIAAVIHIVHSETLDRVIHYTEVSFTSPCWPVALDGYHIAFITDVHTIVIKLEKHPIKLVFFHDCFVSSS